MVDGAIYYGEWTNGKANGCGLMIYPDKTVISGTWCHGKRDGIVRTTHPNDSISFSKWRNGRYLCPVDTLEHEGSFGIDLSKYQYGNWGSMLILAKQDADTVYIPISFTILKATEGKDIVDPLYSYHSKMAAQMRIPQGAYHVFSMYSDAQKQANNFISAIQGGELPDPLVLDIEGSTLEIPMKTFQKIKKHLKQWLQKVEKETNRKPLIYCCYDFFRNYGDSEIFYGYDFWVANYTERSPYEDWTIHQFTDQGRVLGWPYNVDIDFRPEKLFERL